MEKNINVDMIIFTNLNSVLIFAKEHMKKNTIQNSKEKQYRMVKIIQCGHIIFSDAAKTGDGLASALQVLALIIKSKKKASVALNPFSLYPQILENLKVSEKVPLKDIKGSATGEFFPLFEVSLDDVTRGYDGGGADIIRDMNRFLPDTDQSMLAQFDNEVVEFAQLAPLMKMDLAVLSPAFRFMVLLYGTPFLYAPKKLVRFINIGKFVK